MAAFRPSKGRTVAAAFYGLYFGSVGVTLPFLPPYLAARGLKAGQIGLLLAFTPALSLVGPLGFGRLADRQGAPHRVLAGVCAGAAVCFAPLLGVGGFRALMVVLLAYACFAGSITPLIDSVTLDHLSERREDFGRVRLFGSLGFVVASVGFGLLASASSPAVVALPAALLAGCAFIALGLRPPRHLPGPATALPSLRTSFRARGESGLLLIACALHWIASGPYNGSFALFLQSRGMGAAVVGTAAAVGVLAEVAVMASYPWVAGRVSPRAVLALSFVASAVRWWAMGLAWTPAVMVGLGLLHGLTFGAFYVAAVGLVDARAALGARTKAQAMFAAVTFGVGGLVGYLASGVGYEVLGGARLFECAGLVELLATAALFSAPALASVAPRQA